VTLALTGLLSALALTACSVATGGGAGSMMRGAVGTGTAGSGTRMMGGGSGYSYSRPTCSAPIALPGTRVKVMLGDMGMTRMMSGLAPLGARMMLHAVPATVPAGQVSFVVDNMGWRTHELVVLPLADGATAGARVSASDGKVDESGGLGEASNTCAAGSGDGLRAGSAGWVTMTLAAGRYELVCNQPNHYADGMWQELDVV
jgi:uncharacterized cupredoxin-like copper-binding protein